MQRRSRRPRQLELAGTAHPVLHGRGGARPGAGRPRIHDVGIAHRARPSVSPKLPLHVTLRMEARVYNLRTGRPARVIERAFLATSETARIVHYSVQGKHIHLLVEANDRRALSSAMRRLGIRIGLGMNKLMQSSGRVLAHRYHARSLRSPTEVYCALGYVRNNRALHALRNGTILLSSVDPYSSDGAALRFFAQPPTTWLLRDGWRRAVRADP